MKIIDAHTHIFPDKIAEPAVKATAVFYETCDTPIKLDTKTMCKHLGTVEDLANVSKDAGIESCLVFSAATAAKQVESINSFIGRTLEAHPNWYGAGTMHADYTEFDKECDRVLELGMKGIKIHPDIQHFTVDDERLFPLYETMASKHLFLITHAGDNRFDFSGPKRIEKVAKMFPKLPIISAHFGGWSEWDDAREFLRLENVFVDTSSTIQFAGPETALKGIEAFAPDHVFFGTDFPMWDPKTEIETILNLGLSEERLEMIFHKNFEMFIKEL